MLVKKEVVFPSTLGCNPKEKLWWFLGNCQRRFSGLTLAADVFNGKGRVVGDLLTSKGAPSSSCTLRFPGDPKDLRAIGKLFFEIADEVEKEVRSQNACKP